MALVVRPWLKRALLPETTGSNTGTSRRPNIPNGQRCPSRGYRRDVLEDDDDELVANNTTAIPRIVRTENGNHYFEMFGKIQLGDDVWHHDVSLTNGTTSKVVAFPAYEAVFGPAHLQRRQTCG